jgi:glycosyltransferase involved in cell wall biosynthesis
LFHNGTACSASGYHFLRCISRRCYRNSVVYSAWYAAILLWHRFRKTFKRCIDRLIVLNTFTRDIFVQNGFDASKISVKPNAVDPVPVQSGNSYDHAVFIGRFSREKGIITLLNALKQVPGLKIRIIGSGPLEQYVKDCAASGSCPGIELTGYQPFSECCRQMADALVTVFPSECYENCPLTIITSLWYGTPVIASRIGGIPDFVPEDIGGWLFEPGSADDLAKKLQWVMENRDTVIERRTKAQQWAQEQFDPETNYTRLLEIYRDTIQKPPYSA